MSQRAIELILIRRWASYLDQAIFLIGADGHLLYYNDAASELLGRPYDQSEDITAAQLGDVFDTATAEGVELPGDQLPIAMALTERKPKHGRLRFVALNGVEHLIDVTALPLIGQTGVFQGVLTIFWEVDAA